MTFEQISALLATKFPGVRKDGLAHIARAIALQVTTDEEAHALVDKLEVDKVTEAVKDYRKNVDKEVSEATKTHETNLKKKFNFSEKTTEPEPTTPGPTDPTDVASIIKAAVAEAVKPLQDKLSSFEGERTTGSRLSTLEGKIQNMPETFKAKVLKDFKRMTFQDDAAFTEYLTETETDISAFNQELADSGLGQQGKPMFGKNTEVGEVAAAKIAENRNSGASTGVTGKKI